MSAIDSLRWIRLPLPYSAKGESNTKTSNSFTAGTDCADSKSASEAFWDDDATFGATIPTRTSTDGAPYAYSGIEHIGSQAQFGSGIDRRYSYAQVSPPKLLNRVVEFFLHPVIVSGSDPDEGCSLGANRACFTYDTNGDFTGDMRTWVRFGTSSVSHDTVVEQRVGAASLDDAAGKPTWSDCPGALSPPTLTHWSTFRGYQVSDSAAIVKYDVENGLTYVTPSAL